MRMSAFLRNARGLHQSAVDVPIDLAIWVNNLFGIILCDDRDGFSFALRALEAKAGIGLRRVTYGLLAHWSHWLHRKCSPRFLRDCSRRLFGGRFGRLLGDHLCRLFVDGWF